MHGRGGDAREEGLQRGRTVDFLLVERVLGHIVVAHVSPKVVRVGEVVGPGRVGEDDGVVLGVGAGSRDPFLGSAWQLRDVEDGGVGVVHGGVDVDGVSREVVWEMEVTVALFWKFPMSFLGRLDAVRAKRSRRCRGVPRLDYHEGIPDYGGHVIPLNKTLSRPSVNHQKHLSTGRVLAAGVDALQYRAVSPPTPSTVHPSRNGAGGLPIPSVDDLGRSRPSGILGSDPRACPARYSTISPRSAL